MTQSGNAREPLVSREEAAQTGLFGRLRGDLLSVVSAIGSALTVISTLQDTLTVATWARAIVDGFQASASTFWAFIMPWLTVSPRPMDVVFFNMAAFLGLITLASLGPRAQTPSSCRDASWRHELLAGVGGCLAIAFFVWAGLSAVLGNMESGGTQLTQFLAALEVAQTDAERDAAGLAYLTNTSAFIPFVDAWGLSLGLTSGPLTDRLFANIWILLTLHVVIILTPMFAVLGVGAALGYRSDSRKFARWSWLFLAMVAAVVVLSWVSGVWAEMCGGGGEGVLSAVCGVVS